VIAFKSFTVADMVPASTGGTFAGNVAVNGNLTVDTDTLFVDAANNRVGVGTTSPSGKLDIVTGTTGNVLIDAEGGSSSHAKVVNDSGDLHLGSRNTSADTYITSQRGIFLKSGSSETERARIDESGNLLVGTTSLLSSGKTNVLFNGQTQIGLSMQTTFGSVGSDFIRFLDSSGTQIGEIEQNGASTVIYATSSDYRLKEDVQPMVGSVDRLMALKPVNFAWKADGSRVDGFIAHEAQAVVPECVSGTKDQVQIVEIKDEDGNVTGTEERPVYQGIDQSKIVPLLTAALQEALTKIEQLEARMAILEGGAA
jgi:hypothetical protein